MTKDKPHKTLRKKAEQIARGESTGLTEEEQFDLLLVAQELETTQFDLEAQNEQLRQVSRDLEASRAEFADLYEFAPVAFVTLNPKGIIQRANAAARQMLTGNEHSMIGFLFSNFVVPEDLSIYFEHKKKPNRKHKVSVFDLRLKGADNRRLHAHVQTFVRFDPEGEAAQSDLVFFDVSEQRQLEEELKTSQENLALATRAGGIGIWNNFLEDRVSYWNDQLYRLLGLDPKKGPEDTEAFFAYIHPEDRKGALKSLQNLLASGNGLDLEFRIVREDGQVRWFAAKGSIDRDDGGRPVRMQGINWDITDKKRHELELQKSRERFQAVLEHSLDVAFRRNVQTKQYDYLSPVIEQMTGYFVDEVIAMNSEELTELVHPEDRVRVSSEVEHAYRAGSGKVEFRLRKKEGGYLWVADFFTVQNDPAGSPLYRIGVLRDISSKKEVENALKEKQQVLSEKLLLLERSNRELSEYAYAVSHDLKAPLRAVRNYADFLIEDLEGQLSGEQKAYLEGMKKALSQGDELIRDLLDFARIGEAEEETEAVDLEELLREVCEVLNLSEDMQVSVRSGCPPLKTKRTMLNQILINLIGNGLKFNTADVKRVEVWCRPAPNERMALLVKDNGLGIEKRYQKQIFRVFQRLHSAQKYGGTGIGLAIVRKAAARLGGSVRLESTPGEGSTFIVDLPRTPPA